MTKPPDTYTVCVVQRSCAVLMLVFKQMFPQHHLISLQLFSNSNDGRPDQTSFSKHDRS